MKTMNQNKSKGLQAQEHNNLSAGVSGSSNQQNSKQNMEEITLDLRPHQKPYNPQCGFGREVLRNVYYRIEVPYYTYTLGYTKDEEKIQMGEKNTKKFMYEVVDILQDAGWVLVNTEWQDEHSHGCPQLTKNNQRLYCHPQNISGEVNTNEVDTIAQLFTEAKTFKHYKTDNYRDVIVTTSADDEVLLYHQMRDSIVRKVLEELTTTKRRNLYKSEASVEYKLMERMHIDTKRAGEIYNFDKVEFTYVHEIIEKTKADGWLITATGRDNMPLVRWANKTEQKKLLAA